MKALVNIRLILLLLAMLPAAAVLHAQNPASKNAALFLMQQGKPDSALIEINKYLAMPGTATDGDAFMIKGQIYKDLYKKYSPAEPLTYYLDSSVVYLNRALNYEKDSAQQIVIRKSLLYVASRYYNSAADRLDTLNFDKAEKCYYKYRAIALTVDPKMNIAVRDIEFLLALSTVYEDKYNNNKSDTTYRFKAEQIYVKILEMDPGNYDGHYRYSLLKWNHGVDIIFSLPTDATIPQTDSAQDEAVKRFKEALPHAEKAYEIRPDRIETLVMLSGIYGCLGEYEKAAKFDEMRRDLERRQQGKGK